MLIEYLLSICMQYVICGSIALSKPKILFYMKYIAGYCGGSSTLLLQKSTISIQRGINKIRAILYGPFYPYYIDFLEAFCLSSSTALSTE